MSPNDTSELETGPSRGQGGHSGRSAGRESGSFGPGKESGIPTDSDGVYRPVRVHFPLGSLSRRPLRRVKETTSTMGSLVWEGLVLDKVWTRTDRQQGLESGR